MRGWRLLVVLLLLGPLLAAGSPKKGWVWPAGDLAAIKKLEAQVAMAGDRFRVRSTGWIVETKVDARFTAELAQFMERFQALFEDAFDGVHEGVKIADTPSVLIYDTMSEYERVHSDGSRAHWRYGRDKNGALVAFHIFSYVEEEEERKFETFHNRFTLQGQAAQLLLRRYAGDAALPEWLTVGTAAYFKTWSVLASGAQNRKSCHPYSDFRDELTEAFSRKSPPTLASLLGKGPGTENDTTGQSEEKAEGDELDEEHAEVDQRARWALAESFVSYLLSSPESKLAFKDIFACILAKQPAVAPDRIAALETAWHAHVRTMLRAKK